MKECYAMPFLTQMIYIYISRKEGKHIFSQSYHRVEKEREKKYSLRPDLHGPPAAQPIET
jgi:hypothetical protein